MTIDQDAGDKRKTGVGLGYAFSSLLVTVFLLLCQSNLKAQGAKERVATKSATITFDVVSFKPSGGSGSSQVWLHYDDRLVFNNISMEELVFEAFGVDDAKRIVGLPHWAASKHYDLDARVDATGIPLFKTLGEKERLELLRTILSDRCRLRVEQSNKKFKALALHKAPTGSKLVLVANNEHPDTRPAVGGEYHLDPGHLRGVAVTMERLTETLSSITHMMIVDQTGLHGTYTYDLRWNPDWDSTGDSSSSVSPKTYDRADPITAIREQLGLVLEPIQEERSFFVIEHLEEPSSN